MISSRVTEIEHDTFGLYITEYTDNFTDLVTGNLYNNTTGITININGSKIDVYGYNIDSFKDYCENPADIPEDSWMHTTEEMIGDDTCFICDDGELTPENTILLSVRGSKPGLHLMCSTCSSELANVLSEVSSATLLSRTI